MVVTGGSGADGGGAITLFYRSVIITAATQVVGKLLQHLSCKVKEKLSFCHELYDYQFGILRTQVEQCLFSD